MDDHRLALDGIAEVIDDHLVEVDEFDEPQLPENPEIFYVALRSALDRLEAYGEPLSPESVIH